MTFFRHVIRFVVSALVIMLVAALVPGFSITGFWSALVAGLVIALVGWAVEAIMGRNISPFGRGLVGFIASVVVIYLSQFFVPGFRVSLFGALIGALVIGVIDLFIPTGTVLKQDNKNKG
ncbi:phage holin family protein [Paludifilum halophilum]|uniref:Phage holin family protein n=1 Tax=Paludifilum halophilum TaxID=1642702 RepID=A0A235B7R3_9BACL|nr:phage holin family protein [Paludifilum halophilum]OYD08344.1 hypothetical protein CHM34_05740 [Paludifilum halophilum]